MFFFFFEQVFIISQTHCTGAAVFQGFEVDCEQFVLLKFSRFFFQAKTFRVIGCRLAGTNRPKNGGSGHDRYKPSV